VQSPDRVPTQTATVIPVFANPTREVGVPVESHRLEVAPCRPLRKPSPAIDGAGSWRGMVRGMK
jgi:hypothetical protein